VAGGSRAAAQALVLTQQADLLRGLLATALGRHGCQSVSGVPIAKVLALAGRVFEQAAVDADKLMYLEQQPDAAESLAADRAHSGAVADHVSVAVIGAFEARSRRPD